MSRLLLLADAQSLHTQRWAAYFVDRGWEVAVASLRAADLGPRIEVWPLVGSLPGRLGYATVLPLLRRRVRAFRPDLVHAHYATSYGLLGALAGARPLVTSVWGSDVYEWPQRGPLHRALLRHNLARADALCATSHDLARAAAPYAPGRAWHVTPFGVDTERFSPGSGPAQPPIIGSIRNVEWRYGLDLLIRAFARLDPALGARLVIAGDGPQRAEYRALAQELGVGHRVSLDGHVPNTAIVDLLRTFAVFAAPSRIEAFCVAALEAEACGVPAVVSHVGGLPEVVRDGETGLIVPPEDSEALARALDSLLRDEGRRARLGRQAREHVLANYRWEDNAALMAGLYARLTRRV